MEIDKVECLVRRSYTQARAMQVNKVECDADRLSDRLSCDAGRHVMCHTATHCNTLQHVMQVDL